MVYDTAKVTHEKLLDVYWRNIDPVTRDAQFCPGGNDYRTAIFCRSPEQKDIAQPRRVVHSQTLNHTRTYEFPKACYT